MYKLGIPFLYGPVSGGENTPPVIRYPMSAKSRVVEMIRTASQVFFRLTPNFARTMKGSTLILTTTEETKAVIPKKYHNKVKVFQSIGLTEDIFYPEPVQKPERTPRFLMAGRMLYWKGFELGISAFVKAMENGFKGELVILGDTENNPGYEAHKNMLQKMCGKYLDKEIKFVPKVEHSRMKEFYDGFDVLINCSLRDSGCFIVMEGMSRALPSIIVNTGGPKVNTTSDSAIKIEPAPMRQMIDEVANAIVELGNDKEKREIMGRAAREHALSNFLIDKKTESMGKYYEKVVK